MDFEHQGSPRKIQKTCEASEHYSFNLVGESKTEWDGFENTRGCAPQISQSAKNNGDFSKQCPLSYHFLFSEDFP